MLKRVILILLSMSMLIFASTSQNTQKNNFSREDAVVAIYMATLNRAPDPAGLYYWVNISTLPIEGIAKSFFDQVETQEKYPDLENQYDEFIDNSYQSLFNRKAEPGGKNYWLAELQSKRVSPDQFVLALMNGAKGDDIDALRNRIIVSLIFAHSGEIDLEKARKVLLGVGPNPESIHNGLRAAGLEEGPLSGNSQTDNNTTGDNNTTTLTLVAKDKNVTTHKNQPISIPFDLNVSSDSNLTYKVVTYPNHGSISVEESAFKYTPSLNYVGNDVFSYEIKDEETNTTSNTAIVSIKITNAVPVAKDMNLTTNKNKSKKLKLEATDDDDENLTYKIVSYPSHGSLSGDAPNLTYTPSLNYAGSDSFTFKANDGTVDSNTATVSIKVLNKAPIAKDMNVTAHENKTSIIVLEASDPDNDSLTYSIISQPSHGSISINDRNVTYTPDSDYFGSDSFKFKVNDGTVDSNTATVYIDVLKKAPIAYDQNVTVRKNKSVDITLTTDEDNESLTYTVSNPSHGTLSGTAPNLRYTPNVGYAGDDSFIFKVNDGTNDSNEATISIKVLNTVPVAYDQNVTVEEGRSASITLNGKDEDGDNLSYEIVNNPIYGQLSIAGKNVTYTPNRGYIGSDNFTFRVNDGDDDSNIATVDINVTERAIKIRVKTDNNGLSNSNQFTIVTDSSNYSYDYSIDCDSDGEIDATNMTGDYTCEYNGRGKYTISITGQFPHLTFVRYDETGITNTVDSNKVISIVDWGSQKWKSFKYTLADCSNAIVEAQDAPNLFDVTDMQGAFYNASKFDSDISDWNVSSVTNMSSMFDGALSFDQDIGNWDVSNVKDMSNMFKNASKFNQDISSWNVSSVTNMSGMFDGASKFNQPIGNWDVSNVKDMSNMFRNAAEFNQNINNWDVSKVTTMSGMFDGASQFNQPIGNWDTSSVTDMSKMFRSASSFNQNIATETWIVNNVTDMSEMFAGATSFNQNISGWGVGKVTNMRGMFAAATSFNQNISGWSVGNVTDMSEMFMYASGFKNHNLRYWDVGSVQDHTNFCRGWGTGNTPPADWSCEE